jgi:hypothetical protein
MPPSTAPARPKGWEIIRQAFLDAPKRTLTNHELGDVPGVQAFHQRISNLKDQGYVFAAGVRVGPGRYAYRLLGVQEGKPAARCGLPVIPWNDLMATISLAESDLRDNPPAERTTSDARTEARTEARGLRERNAELEAENAQLREVVTRDEDDEILDDEPGVAQQVAANTSRVLAARNTLADVLGEPVTDSLMDGLDLTALALRAAEQLKAKPRAARAPRAEHGPTGPQLMRQVLEAAGRPLHSKVIAERVLTSGGDALYKGKTPAATMAAQLATSNKAGGEFVKTEPGCFALREWAADKLEAEPVKS